MISLKFILLLFSILLILRSCLPGNTLCKQSQDVLPSLGMHFLETTKTSCENAIINRGEKIL